MSLSIDTAMVSKYKGKKKKKKKKHKGIEYNVSGRRKKSVNEPKKRAKPDKVKSDNPHPYPMKTGGKKKSLMTKKY